MSNVLQGRKGAIDLWCSATLRNKLRRFAAAENKNATCQFNALSQKFHGGLLWYEYLLSLTRGIWPWNQWIRVRLGEPWNVKIQEISWQTSQQHTFLVRNAGPLENSFGNHLASSCILVQHTTSTTVYFPSALLNFWEHFWGIWQSRSLQLLWPEASSSGNKVQAVLRCPNCSSNGSFVSICSMTQWRWLCIEKSLSVTLPMIVTLSLEFIPKKGLQAGRPMPGYFLSLNVPNTSCLDGTQTTSTATRRVLGRLFNALLCCLDLLSSFFLQQRHRKWSKMMKLYETCFTSRRTNSAWGLEGEIWENYGTIRNTKMHFKNL